MKGIEVAFQGIITREATAKISRQGREWINMRVTVQIGAENEENILVAAFAPDLVAMLPMLVRHVEVYIEGKLRLQSLYEEGGAAHPCLAVTANTIMPLGVIGEKKRTTSRAKKAPPRKSVKATPAEPVFNDDLPF